MYLIMILMIYQNLFKNLSSKEIRKELGEIKESVEEINNRVNQFMESISKHSKNKDYER